MSRQVRRGIAIAAAMVAAGLLLITISPPLSIHPRCGYVDVDVRRFGEYNSVLRAIEIREVGRKMPLWNAIAGDTAVRIFRFSIFNGFNPQDLGLRAQDAAIEVAMPAEPVAVEFKPGQELEVLIVANQLFPFGLELRSSEQFMMPVADPQNCYVAGSASP